MNTWKSLGILMAITLAGSGILSACGSDDPAGASADARASVSATPNTPTPTPTAPTRPADLELAPGSAGPIKVGMSKADVSASGFFETSDPQVEGCGPDLVWVKPYRGTFDVYDLGNGSIASIGVRKAGPTTASGLGIGSTLAEVLAANTGAKAVEAGYGQTGVLVNEPSSDGWIGYLFNAALQDVKDTDEVTFIELTQGEKPGLMRDGC